MPLGPKPLDMRMAPPDVCGVRYDGAGRYRCVEFSTLRPERCAFARAAVKRDRSRTQQGDGSGVLGIPGENSLQDPWGGRSGGGEDFAARPVTLLGHTRFF